MLSEQSFETNDVKIHYVEGPPSGAPLVLLPGGTNRWQQFLPLIPHLLKARGGVE